MRSLVQVQDGPFVFGGLAQLVERLLCKQDVSGSSPLTSISTVNLEALEGEVLGVGDLGEQVRAESSASSHSQRWVGWMLNSAVSRGESCG